MVYTGKPSKGCHNCRRRKIQCDQLPSGCSQCSHSRRPCPGYLEHADFVFRDETESITRKLQANTSVRASRSLSSSISRKTQAQSTSYGRSVTCQYKNSPKTLSSLRSLSPSGDEQATAFFLSNFVLGAAVTTEGHLQHITHINYEADEHLLASMKAVGCVGLYGSRQDPTLLADARKHYVTAVRHTNVALRSPTYVKQDSTLLAVLVLCLFERVAGNDSESLIDFEHHVKGAAAILKVRGREQLNSPGGRHLFIQVASALLALCILQEIHIPLPILELREEPLIRADIASLESMQVLDMTITVVEFNANVKDGTIADPSYIVAQALELDRDFQLIFLKAPMSWKYETLYDANADPHAVFGGYYHRYDSIWTARMWNILRIMRISLHTNILDTLLKLPSSSSPASISLGHSAQVCESRDVMRMMQADILASVPEYMGHHLDPSWLSDSHQATDRQDKAIEEVTSKQPIYVGTPMDKSALKAKMITRGQYIILPLYKAGMVDVDEATKTGRLWSRQMLQYIGQVVGIRQALMFATIIEKIVQ